MKISQKIHYSLYVQELMINASNSVSSSSSSPKMTPLEPTPAATTTNQEDHLETTSVLDPQAAAEASATTISPAAAADLDGPVEKPVGGCAENKAGAGAEAAEEDEEWSKLRCGSLTTEEIVRKEKQKEDRQKNRQNRCADYPGFAFGSAMFGSDTTMKFNIIKNELHNIMRSQLKRVDGEVKALSSRVKEFDTKLEESEKYIREATHALSEAVAIQIEESKERSEEDEQESSLSAFDQHVLFLEEQLKEARLRARLSFQILETCDQEQSTLLSSPTKEHSSIPSSPSKEQFSPSKNLSIPSSTSKEQSSPLSSPCKEQSSPPKEQLIIDSNSSKSCSSKDVSSPSKASSPDGPEPSTEKKVTPEKRPINGGSPPSQAVNTSQPNNPVSTGASQPSQPVSTTTSQANQLVNSSLLQPTHQQKKQKQVYLQPQQLNHQLPQQPLHQQPTGTGQANVNLNRRPLELSPRKIRSPSPALNAKRAEPHALLNSSRKSLTPPSDNPNSSGQVRGKRPLRRPMEPPASAANTSTDSSRSTATSSETNNNNNNNIINSNNFINNNNNNTSNSRFGEASEDSVNGNLPKASVKSA